MTSYLFKCVFLGSQCVGKTAMRTKLLYDDVETSYSSTIGVEIGLLTATVGDKQVKAQIWDTSGDARFRALAVAYLRGAHAVFLFFDSRRKDTLANLRDYVELYNMNKVANSLLVIVCTKCDSHDRIITQKEGQQFARSIKALYFEFSASTFTQHQTQQILDTVLSTLVTAFDARVNDATHYTPPQQARTPSIVAGESMLSSILKSLKTMFVCSTCVVPSTTASTTTKSSDTVQRATKTAPMWVKRECPCFECQRLPTLRVGREMQLRIVH